MPASSKASPRSAGYPGHLPAGKQPLSRSTTGSSASMPSEHSITRYLWLPEDGNVWADRRRAGTRAEEGYMGRVHG